MFARGHDECERNDLNLSNKLNALNLIYKNNNNNNNEIGNEFKISEMQVSNIKIDAVKIEEE